LASANASEAGRRERARVDRSMLISWVVLVTRLVDEMGGEGGVDLAA
jgi:hypothetical protein